MQTHRVHTRMPYKKKKMIQIKVLLTKRLGPLAGFRLQGGGYILVTLCMQGGIKQ